MRIPLMVCCNLEKVKEGPIVWLDAGFWAIRSFPEDIPVRVKLDGSPGLHALPLDCESKGGSIQAFVLAPVKLEVSIFAELLK